MTKVKDNDTVKVHYTGKLSDGQVFDSSVEREPLQFTIGEGKLIPGFEQGVVGMAVNEKKTIEIPSDKAYGPAREDLIQEIPKTQLPEDLKPEVGMELVSQQPDGNQLRVKVIDVEDATIKIDANHPLAGKDLTFDLEVVEIG